MEDKGSQWKSVSRCGDFILCSECVNFLSSSRKCSSVHTGYSKERGEESSPSHIRSKHSPHTSKAITPAHHNSNSRSTIRTYYKLKPIHEVLTPHEEISFPERILEPAEYDPSQIRHSQPSAPLSQKSNTEPLVSVVEDPKFPKYFFESTRENAQEARRGATRLGAGTIRCKG